MLGFFWAARFCFDGAAFFADALGRVPVAVLDCALDAATFARVLDAAALGRVPVAALDCALDAVPFARVLDAAAFARVLDALAAVFPCTDAFSRARDAAPERAVLLVAVSFFALSFGMSAPRLVAKSSYRRYNSRDERYDNRSQKGRSKAHSNWNCKDHTR